MSESTRLFEIDSAKLNRAPNVDELLEWIEILELFPRRPALLAEELRFEQLE